MLGTSPPRAKARWRRRAHGASSLAGSQACTREMRDGKRPIAATDKDTPGETTDTDNLRSRASSSTPPSTDTVGLAPRTHPSKRRRTRGGLSEGGGSSSSDTSAGSVSLLFGVPAEVAALMIKHCDPVDFAALCMCCRALHTLVEQARILLTLTLADPPTTLTRIRTLTLTLTRTRTLTRGYAYAQSRKGTRCRRRCLSARRDATSACSSSSRSSGGALIWGEMKS